MPVSFNPDWQTAGQASGASLSVGVPLGGSVQVATVIVGNNRTLTDLSGFTTMISGVSDGTVGIRYYHLKRSASSDPISFGFSGSALALAVVGAYPAGSYTWIEPHVSTSVPGEPGQTYRNPDPAVSNSSLTLDHVEEWVPADGGRVAGWLHDATDNFDEFEQADLTLTSPEGDTDVSPQVFVTGTNPDGDTLHVKLIAYALESAENPCEIHLSETVATSDSSRRIMGVLGGALTARWRLGRVGWSAAGASSTTLQATLQPTAVPSGMFFQTLDWLTTFVDTGWIEDTLFVGFRWDAIEDHTFEGEVSVTWLDGAAGKQGVGNRHLFFRRYDASGSTVLDEWDELKAATPGADTVSTVSGSMVVNTGDVLAALLVHDAGGSITVDDGSIELVRTP